MREGWNRTPFKRKEDTVWSHPSSCSSRSTRMRSKRLRRGLPMAVFTERPTWCTSEWMGRCWRGIYSSWLTLIPVKLDLGICGSNNRAPGAQLAHQARFGHRKRLLLHCLVYGCLYMNPTIRHSSPFLRITEATQKETTERPHRA